MTTTPSVVQFPHPGPERLPKPLQVDAELPWNTGNHGRKFLLSPGIWIYASGTQQQGDLTFWGEWEPQSRVIEVLPATQPGLPRALQQPWFSVTDTGWRQNTDPLVFGDHFSYTNCKQPRIGKLRALAPGSVILFGSKLAGGFVLDTVLVVAAADKYRPTQGPPDGATIDAAELITDPLALDPKIRDASLTWYRGATRSNPTSGMYSFAPARPYQPGSAGFARPCIDLDGLVNPNLAMSAKSTQLPLSQISSLWDRLVEQVFDAGLVLATHLPTPKNVTQQTVTDSDRPTGTC